MKTGSIVAFLVASARLGASSVPGSFSPSPPLWDLVGHADLIAVVRVERFEEQRALRPEDAVAGTVVLTILENWKGSWRGEVRADLRGQLHAGGRPVAVGEQILAFLKSAQSQMGSDARFIESGDLPLRSPDARIEPERRRDESQPDRFSFVSSELAVNMAGAANVRPIRDLIFGAIRLQSEAAMPSQIRREWLVPAASSAATRRYVAGDLRRLLEATISRSNDDPSRPEGFSEGELRAMADAFVRDPSADWSVPELMSLLSRLEDDAFERTAISVIEAAIDAPRIPGWVPEAIRQLVIRGGWRDWGAAVWQRDLHYGTLRSIWPAVARDLQLPSVPPARLKVDTED